MYFIPTFFLLYLGLFDTHIFYISLKIGIDDSLSQQKVCLVRKLLMGASWLQVRKDAKCTLVRGNPKFNVLKKGQCLCMCVHVCVCMYVYVCVCTHTCDIHTD